MHQEAWYPTTQNLPVKIFCFDLKGSTLLWKKKKKKKKKKEKWIFANYNSNPDPPNTYKHVNFQ